MTLQTAHLKKKKKKNKKTNPFASMLVFTKYGFKGSALGSAVQAD